MEMKSYDSIWDMFKDSLREGFSLARFIAIAVALLVMVGGIVVLALIGSLVGIAFPKAPEWTWNLIAIPLLIATVAIAHIVFWKTYSRFRNR